MDFFNHIKSIEVSLRAAGYIVSADDLRDRQLAFGTGGEVLSSCCSRLLGLKKWLPEAYETIREPAEELLAYAKSIGYGPFFETYPEPSTDRSTLS